MKLLRFIPFLVLVGIVGTAFWGSATALKLDPNSLTAGSTNVTRCDDNVQVYWRTEWNKTADEILLKGVTIAGINSACDGKNIRVVVTDKSGNKLALAKTTVPTTSDNNVRIEFTKCSTFDPQGGCQPVAHDVNDIHVAIHD